MNKAKRFPVAERPSQNLGDLIEKLNSGNLDVSKFLQKWRDRRAAPLLRSIDRQLNANIMKLFMPLIEGHRVLDIKPIKFDGSFLFVNKFGNSLFQLSNRSQTIQEAMWSLFRKYDAARSTIDNLTAQGQLLQSNPLPDEFIELKDTPSSYAGADQLFLGTNANGTALAFVKPTPNKRFLDLSDVNNSYKANGVFYTASGEVRSANPAKELMLRNVQQHVATLPSETITFNGAGASNLLLLLDINTDAACNDLHVKLGPTFHGARVCIKVVAGEHNTSTKVIEPDGTTTFRNGTISSVPLDPNFAYTFVYDNNNNTYWLKDFLDSSLL